REPRLRLVDAWQPLEARGGARRAHPPRAGAPPTGENMGGDRLPPDARRLRRATRWRRGTDQRRLSHRRGAAGMDRGLKPPAADVRGPPMAMRTGRLRGDAARVGRAVQ